MAKIGFIIILLIFLFVTIINYLYVKKMISFAPKSVYPLFQDEWGNMYTRRGKNEKPTFQMKSWREKRVFFAFSLLFISIAIIFMFYFWEAPNWSSVLLLFIIPLNFLVHAKVPSFFALEKGFYYDEVFFRWEDVKEFSVGPVTLGSEGHGMFENSTSYTEIKIYIEKNGKSKSVYVEDDNAVEKFRQIFLNHGWKDISSKKEKQPTVYN